MTFAFYLLLACGLIGLCYWLLIGNRKEKSLDQHFQEFLMAYAAWHASGAGDHPIFTRRDGLCGLWIMWCQPWIDGPRKESPGRISRNWEVNRMLTNRFKEEGLCPSYPFNEGLGGNYQLERIHNLMHTNAKRIQFVRRHIK